jgi:hypothetical protein
VIEFISFSETVKTLHGPACPPGSFFHEEGTIPEPAFLYLESESGDRSFRASSRSSLFVSVQAVEEVLIGVSIRSMHPKLIN